MSQAALAGTPAGAPAGDLRVGGVPFPGRIFLAPVAGYSDAAYRSVCSELGADLCYTEMVSAEAFTRGHPATRALLGREACEKHYAIQLFGGKPEVLAQAVGMLEPWKPLIIDLNCGCPVPKIVRAHAGSSLLKTPDMIREIVIAMVEAAKGTPVTVKIRSGWDTDSINYPETARAAIEGGASAVTLHARTRAQGYSGKADWSHIASLVRMSPVPVFGSGDIFSARDAARMMEETGCAGVMIARGAIGNPFIFTSTQALLRGVDEPVIGVQERAEVALRHLRRSVHWLGERTACIEFRKQFCAYTKGTPGGAALRESAVRSTTVTEYEKLCRLWVESAGRSEPEEVEPVEMTGIPD